MTLTTFERRLIDAPSPERFIAAGPAFRLRLALRDGASFTEARDRLVGQASVFRALRDVGRLAAFRELSGP